MTDKYIDIYSNTVRTDVTVYTDRNKSEIAFTLKEGDRVLELGGDAHCWVKILKADTHEEGWLYSKAYEQLKCPDGNYLYANESPVFLEDEESGLSMFSDLHYGG